MAHSKTLYRPIDAFVNESTPGVNTDDLKLRSLKLKATGSTDERRAFLYFKMPFEVSKDDVNSNIVIISATLKLRTATNWAASSTITAKRVSSSWKEAKITWTDQPSVGSGSATSGTFSGNGTLVTIDVSTLVSEAVTNKGWFGLRLTTGVTTINEIHSAETLTDGYQPKLDISWSRQPKPPRDLSPSGSRAVGSATPHFTWNFMGQDNFTDQDEYKIQVDDASDFATPVWDPGYVTSAAEGVTCGVSLSAGTTYYWRVRCKDTDGRESDYSDVAIFSYDTKGSLSITNPAAPASNFVEEVTPPITWTLTGETQRASRVYLYRKIDGDYVEIHNSGRVAGSTGSYTIPEKDPESRDRLIRKTGTDEYKVVVQVWDTKTRESTPGDPIYQEASRQFDFRKTVGITAPTGLTAGAYGAHAVQLDWSRTTAPDFWSIYVDGDRVRNRLTPSETLVSGTSYRWIWRGAEPLKTHTYDVEAVVNSSGVYKHSDSTPSVTYRLIPDGIWLLEEDGDHPVKLVGLTVPSLNIGSEETIFSPVGKQAPVLVRQTIRGYEGTVTGQIRASGTPNLTAQDYLDNLFILKKKTMDADIRLLIAANRVNIPIIIGKLQVAPLPDPTNAAGGSGFQITVDIAQVGKFPT